MKINLGLKVLLATSFLALAGCQQTEQQPDAKESLSKASASEIKACPKYEKFINNFATDIMACSQSGNVAGCIPNLTKVFEPITDCLGMDKRTLQTAQDLTMLSQDIGAKVADFDNDPSKASEFIECLCGASVGGSGDLSVGVTFTGSSSAAGGSFTGTTSAAAGGSYTGSSSAAGGSFTGSSSAAGGSFTGK